MSGMGAVGDPRAPRPTASTPSALDWADIDESRDRSAFGHGRDSGTPHPPHHLLLILADLAEVRDPKLVSGAVAIRGPPHPQPPHPLELHARDSSAVHAATLRRFSALVPTPPRSALLVRRLAVGRPFWGGGARGSPGPPDIASVLARPRSFSGRDSSPPRRAPA